MYMLTMLFVGKIIEALAFAMQKLFQQKISVTVILMCKFLKNLSLPGTFLANNSP